MLEITTIHSFKYEPFFFWCGQRGGLVHYGTCDTRTWVACESLKSVVATYSLANYTVDTCTLIENKHFDLLTVCQSGEFIQGGAPCFRYAVGNAGIVGSMFMFNPQYQLLRYRYKCVGGVELI